MQRRVGFDWLAVGIALFITAFFALTARFNSQPAPSFVPAAVLSATGCGLLVTALRKLRGRAGVGLWEAGVAGFFLALFQFAVVFTYPGIFSFVTTIPIYRTPFLLTWGLIGLFAVVLSSAGAALGHLAFAPLRPLPARVTRQAGVEELDDDEDEEEQDEYLAVEMQEARVLVGQRVSRAEDAQGDENGAVLAEKISQSAEDAQESGLDAEEAEAFTSAEETQEDEGEDEDDDENEEEEDEGEVVPRPPRVFASYAINVLLLGLLPMMVGFVFAAAYDAVMNIINIQNIAPGLY
ncbi:MAG: hypothetical protein ACRDHW_24265, partial [Ktedonobacteraceae bacterium]